MVTDDERAALGRLTKRARVNRAIAFRARIVLACIDRSDTAVARRLRTTKTTVAKWRGQFVERRLAGLYDEPRVGAPRTISDEQVEAIIVKTLETTPAGETHGSTRSMAQAAGVSHTLVGRIWRTFRLQPNRTESFKLSPDPQLVEKIRDVVGLYVAPPANAVVFSVDEKSQIQALQRAQPILPMDFGQPERRTHNDVRHGTLDLFAALNVATGEVLARCKPQHRAQDFVAFLREIEASVEPALDIHVVLDNLSAHRAPPVQRWLLRHPRVQFHFTPTYVDALRRRLQGNGSIAQYAWAVEAAHEMRILRNVLVHAASVWSPRAINDFAASLPTETPPVVGAAVSVNMDDVLAYRRVARTLLNAAAQS